VEEFAVILCADDMCFVLEADKPLMGLSLLEHDDNDFVSEIKQNVWYLEGWMVVSIYYIVD